MAPTNTEAATIKSESEFANGGINTLKIPTWFVAVVLILLSVRVYTKLTQMSAPVNQGVDWISPEEIEAKGGTKDLILYEFTADWCPPCQKRERTLFRAPKIIDEINNHYVPVKIDLTKKTAGEQQNIKQLLEQFSISTIPKTVITLRTGEFVTNDSYLYMSFIDFLKQAEKDARNVHAELDMAKGRDAEALAEIDPEFIKGRTMKGFYESAGYVMTYHLLLKMHREKDAEDMMTGALKATKTHDKTNVVADDKSEIKRLLLLNSYLRGEITEKYLIDHSYFDSERATYYLAIGLKHLRDGDKVKALKALHQASLNSARTYDGEKLAEYLTRELE